LLGGLVPDTGTFSGPMDELPILVILCHTVCKELTASASGWIQLSNFWFLFI
jgi:hypothetical protein